MEFQTQMNAARKGIVTKELRRMAQEEATAEQELLELVTGGQVIIPANVRYTVPHPHGVGKGLRTKINANLGVSGDCMDYRVEMEKVRPAERFGAEAIMDLSNYGKTYTFRQKLIETSPAIVGTVPVYDAVGYLEKDLREITTQDFLKVVRVHAEKGVDFMAIHVGLNRRAVEIFMRERRQMNIVSRGGSLLFVWMKMIGNENPFRECYDELLEILYELDVMISLGDVLRPDDIADATDASQIAELMELGNLTERAWECGVQVLVEGPSHMAMGETVANMKLEKRLCHGASLCVLGPLITDIAPGYDHITPAIGGATAATNGADFLCYITLAEHLRLPDLSDVREGTIASKIAAHAADIAKGIKHVRRVDYRISEARGRLDWEETFALTLDREKARTYFESVPPEDQHSCSMCGKMCAVRIMNRILGGFDVELMPERK